MRQIYPDGESIIKVELEHPDIPRADKWRLAQAEMLMKISGAESLEQLEKMEKSGAL